MAERTEHGWERHGQGDRPTREAFQDRQNPQEVYRDLTNGNTIYGDTMARLVSEREESSIRLLTLEVSEGEAGVYALCMKYLLNHLSAKEIERITGAYQDEVEGMLEDLLDIVDMDEIEADLASIAAETPAPAR
ncbi:MAG: hypothetical protein KF893_14355 [Caldilineaceae bacterium]|nr:hypothetical protein [Caldilineaceae bacterium]